MPKPKILIIIPNLGRGGAQKVFNQQLQYLSDLFDVHGCVFNWDGAFDDDQHDRIISLDVAKGNNWFSKIYYFLLRAVRLRRIKRERKIDIAISHLEGADYVNYFSRTNDKVICWVHGTKKFDQNISGLLGIIRHYGLIPFIYRKADKIITVSKGIEGELKKHYRIKSDYIKTIYNGFDIECIMKKSLEAADLPSDFFVGKEKILIAHCRLSRQKNLVSLLHLFKEVKKNVAVKLLIVGDGELRDGLVGVSNQLGLSTWSCWENLNWNNQYEVFFLGQQQNPFKFLRVASLYVMTSDWEGFPLSLCEAMVCGLPVISSDCYTGPKEILAPELNLIDAVKEPYYSKLGALMPLIKSNDEKMIRLWAYTIVQLLGDEALLKKYKKNGIDRVRDFDISNTNKEAFELIMNLQATR